MINGKTVQIYRWISQPRFIISENQSVIEKMFINQSIAKNKAVINGKTVQIYRWISQPRFIISKHESVIEKMLSINLLLKTRL